jgi:peptidoglycan/xylan/chitin deacetylase (PgdA/CDA1 family)
VSPFTDNLPGTLPVLRYLAGAAAGFVTYAGYASMAPRSQFFGHTFTRGDDERKLALTYDDGPNDPHTLHLLDLLAEQGVRATFFLIGRFAAQRPDIVRRIADGGHVIGNHTYSHPNLIFCTAHRVAREIDDCGKAINDAIGAHSNLFRPPFGGRRPGVLRVVRRNGLVPVMWSVASYDWAGSTSAENIERHARRQIKRGGNVILLHDGGHKAMGTDRRHSVEASRGIIHAYKGEGYQFATVPELMQSPPQKTDAVGARATLR